MSTIKNQALNLRGTVAAGNLVSTNARGIEMLKYFPISEIPNLKEHVDSAKGLANKWLLTLLPKIIKNTTHLIHAANDFVVTYDTLMEDIPV